MLAGKSRNKKLETPFGRNEQQTLGNASDRFIGQLWITDSRSLLLAKLLLMALVMVSRNPCSRTSSPIAILEYFC